MTILAAILHARLLTAGVAGSVPVPSPVSVVVDAAVIDGDALTARLVAGTAPLAYALPSAPSPVASILVTGELLDFQVSLTLLVAGATTTTSSQCPCTHAELVAHVQRRLARALRARAVCPAPPPRVSTPPPSPAAPRVVVRERGMGSVGHLGAALVGVGGLAFGVGAGTWVTAMLADHEALMARTGIRTFTISTMAVGSSALVSGALLLLLDRRFQRSRRRAHR
jgi:hypothetical protein